METSKHNRNNDLSQNILTISIAAYNVEQYLDKALQSLVCTINVMNLIEVIIVDDGSTDGTAMIAQKYVDAYPNTFMLISKENGGHGSTMNVALKNASGKYFRMLDGDDWYDTKELEKFVLELVQIDADCIITPYCQVFDDITKCIDAHNMLERSTYDLVNLMNIYRDNKYDAQIVAPEFTIKTEILTKHNLCLKERCMYTDKEYDLFAVLHARTFIKLPYFIYQYRLGNVNQSVGEAGRKKYLPDVEKIIFSLLKMMRQKNTYVVNDDHEKFLYQYIIGTINFYCESLSYVADEIDVGESLKHLTNKLECEYEDFAKYIINNVIQFDWWKWLFSLQYSIEGGKCVVFGAGKYGEKICKYLRKIGIYPLTAVDNNKDLWNSTKCNLEIVSPDKLLSVYKNTKVIIAIKNHPEQIEQQLLSMGVSADRIIMFRK